ncbi:hypothetical protein THRCLA_07216 [Thraustotheca clavata]|uniref:Uncharacterized protein n=1 Tax=Thraustotheca clavata TaxID=74557 RepID=A0A1V9ZFP6_9STRA|nr:hypothetical protein THRCLA_07216 [Thraustotheca clavata]
MNSPVTRKSTLKRSCTNMTLSPEKRARLIGNFTISVNANLLKSEQYRGRCKYKSGRCPNERTIKFSGEAHTLCEEHRLKHNKNQRKSDAKRRGTKVKAKQIVKMEPFEQVDIKQEDIEVKLEDIDVLDCTDLGMEIELEEMDMTEPENCMVIASRRLVVTKQPASEFYKDEGGRSNYLTAEITLFEFNEKKEIERSPAWSFVTIPLRVSLYYESGKPVDKSDQDIFRFVGDEYDSIVIREKTRAATIHFRLEKVSRRKDGQRFKLKVEVDSEQCMAHLDDLAPVFTTAICVLSKRKYPTASDTSNRLKVAKTSDESEIDGLRAQIRGLQNDVNRLTVLLEAQHEMLLSLTCPVAKMGELDAMLKEEAVSFAENLTKTSSPTSPISLTF